MPKNTRRNGLTLGQIDNLLDKRLKPIERQLESHTKTLVTLENETMPMVKDIHEMMKDFNRRVTKLEGRVDNLEPRVGALEVVVKSS